MHRASFGAAINIIRQLACFDWFREIGKRTVASANSAKENEPELRKGLGQDFPQNFAQLRRNSSYSFLTTST
jgi:hypothetical protein